MRCNRFFYRSVTPSAACRLTACWHPVTWLPVMRTWLALRTAMPYSHSGEPMMVFSSMRMFADVLVQVGGFRVGRVDADGNACGTELPPAAQPALHDGVARDEHILGMRALFPPRLGSYVDGRAGASAEEVVRHPHAARLGQQAAGHVAPYDAPLKDQPRELGDVEEVVFAEVCGKGRIEAHGDFRFGRRVADFGNHERPFGD